MTPRALHSYFSRQKLHTVCLTGLMNDEMMKFAPNVPVSSEGISCEMLHSQAAPGEREAGKVGSCGSGVRLRTELIHYRFPFRLCMKLYVTAWGLAAPPTAHAMAIRVRDRFTG